MFLSVQMAMIFGDWVISKCSYKIVEPIGRISLASFSDAQWSSDDYAAWVFNFCYQYLYGLFLAMERTGWNSVARFTILHTRSIVLSQWDYVYVHNRTVWLR